MSEVRNADLSSLRIQRTPVQQQSSAGFPWKPVIISVIVLVLLFVGWKTLQSSLAGATEVDVADATMVSASRSNSVLTASGYVVAQVKAAVSSKVAGRLVALNVIEGDEVKKGQILGRIESADVEATLSQLRAGLEIAKADQASAQAELDDATIDFNRKQGLLKSGAGTQADFDAAQARLRRSQAGLASRKANVDMAAASVRNAEVQVENTVLRAPFDGTVLTKNANVGEVITVMGAAAGSRGAVVTLADMNSLEVEADVSESNIERIHESQLCNVVLDAYPEKQYEAYVNKIIPTADRAKATVQVKIRFANRDARVLPEMGAKVFFMKDSSSAQSANESPKLMVPNSALRTHDAKHFVLVFGSDEHTKETEVQTGTSSNGLTEIRSGIQAGTKVILSPPETLKSGDKVQLRK